MHDNGHAAKSLRPMQPKKPWSWRKTLIPYWFLVLAACQLVLALTENASNLVLSPYQALPYYLAELVIILLAVTVYATLLRRSIRMAGCIHVLICLSIAIVLINFVGGIHSGLTSGKYVVQHVVGGCTFGTRRYLDRTRLLWHDVWGCGGIGIEVYVTYPQNSGNALAAVITSPWRQLYDGPYPNYEEALALVDADPQPLSLVEGAEPPVLIGNQPLIVEFNQRAARGIPQYIESGDARGTIVENRLAVIHLKREDQWADIVLIDMKTKTALARIWPGY